MNIAIDQDRLASITHLYPGTHNKNSSKMCVMEAVAFVTHKEWTDQPPCVCPVLGELMRAWNDALSEDERTPLLRPLIPLLPNTKGSKQLEQRRATMAADWLIRTHTVAWLRLAKLNTQAELLSALPEITDFTQCRALMPTLSAVRYDTATALVAAPDAALAAAWAAAWVAAPDDAPDAALAAAWAAAWVATRDVLSDTRKHLQASLLNLVKRMIELTD